MVGTVVLVAVVAFLFLADEEAGDENGGAPVPAGFDDPRGVMAEVASVTDGDTIEVLLGGRAEDVRYIGIDTPEVDPSIGVECFGAEASALNRRLVSGRTVRLVF